MSIVRFILFHLKPTQQQLLLKKGKGGFVHFYVTLYQRVLQHYAKCYATLAVSDMLSSANAEFQVLHQVRDLEFEKELKRNFIDVNPHLLKGELPIPFKKGPNRKGLSFFHLTDTVEVLVDHQRYFIQHGRGLTIESTFKGKFLYSTLEDIFFRTAMKAETKEAVKLQVESKPSLKKNKERTSLPSEAVPSSSPTESTQYRGFQEDNSF